MRIFLMICFVAMGVYSPCAKTMPVYVYVGNVFRKRDGEEPFKTPFKEPTEAEKEKYLYEDYGYGQGQVSPAYLGWMCEILLTEDPVKNIPVVTNYIDKINIKYLAATNTSTNRVYLDTLERLCLGAVRSLATLKEDAFPLYLKYLQVHSDVIQTGLEQALDIALKRGDPGIREFVLDNIHNKNIYRREDLVFDLFARHLNDPEPFWSQHELDILKDGETDPQIKHCISNLIKGYKTSAEIREWNQLKAKEAELRTGGKGCQTGSRSLL